ncbi:MAG: HIT family protein [Acidimicrobiia bacterium]
MATIFTRIISGELPGVFVWSDETCVAFLSIAPLSPGHVLVVPREEIEHWIDLDPEITQHLITVAQEIGLALDAVYEPEKVGLMIAGLEVPHVHIHVLPINGVSDMDFANAKETTPDELEYEAERIREELNSSL